MQWVSYVSIENHALTHSDTVYFTTLTLNSGASVSFFLLCFSFFGHAVESQWTQTLWSPVLRSQNCERFSDYALFGARNSDLIISEKPEGGGGGGGEKEKKKKRGGGRRKQKRNLLLEKKAKE